MWDRLTELNDALADADSVATRVFTRPENPIVFIAAPPRTASTLFVQAVASRFHVGYVSNVLARFYKAPYFGALLERELLTNASSFVSTFQSSYGNTEGPYEPHEWGWFWKSWLGLTGDEHYCRADHIPDAAGLAAKLAAVESVKTAPLLFDNVYAMANISLLRKALGRVLVVHIDRDPFFVCNSILNARFKRHGDIRAWYGHRPRRIGEILEIEDPVAQVVHQVAAIRDETDRDLADFPESDILRVRYEDFLEEPEGAVALFRDFLQTNGVAVAKKPTSPEFTFLTRNLPTLVNPDYGDRLKRLCRTHFPSANADRAA